MPKTIWQYSSGLVLLALQFCKIVAALEYKIVALKPPNVSRRQLSVFLSVLSSGRDARATKMEKNLFEFVSEYIYCNCMKLPQKKIGRHRKYPSEKV